jgi:hypothetical protein
MRPPLVDGVDLATGVEDDEFWLPFLGIAAKGEDKRAGGGGGPMTVLCERCCTGC